MKKAAKISKRELKLTYSIDIARCVMNFLICSVLCAGGSEWLNAAGVIALITALIPIVSKRFYYKDEYTARAADTVITVYRVLLSALLLYGIDFFLIA